VIGFSLGDVVARCRDRVLSPHLIHHTKKRTMSTPGVPAHENIVYKGFKRAREKTNID